MALVFAVGDFEKERTVEQEIIKKYGIPEFPKFVVFQQDYFFNDKSFNFKAEKNTVARVDDWEVKVNPVTNEAVLYLDLCFNFKLISLDTFSHSYYTLNFKFCKNHKNEPFLVDETSKINFEDLFTLLDENNEVAKANELYSKLLKEYRHKEKRFERIGNLITKIPLPLFFFLGMFIENCTDFNTIITMFIVSVVIILYVIYSERYQIKYSNTKKGKQKLLKIKDAFYAVENISKERV